MAGADPPAPPSRRVAVRARRHDGGREASAGRMIDRLEAKGWVERRAQPATGGSSASISRRRPSACTGASGASPRRRSRMRSPICRRGRARSSAAAGAREEEARRGGRRRRDERRSLCAARARAARTATTGAWRHEEACVRWRCSACRRWCWPARWCSGCRAAAMPRPRTRSSRPTSRRSPARSPGRIVEVRVRDHADGRGRRRAGAPRSRALSARARQGGSRGRLARAPASSSSR